MWIPPSRHERLRRRFIIRRRASEAGVGRRRCMDFRPPHVAEAQAAINQEILTIVMLESPLAI